MLLGTHRADAILASGHVRLHQQAGHMTASDPIKTLSNTLARRGPSTYALCTASSAAIHMPRARMKFADQVQFKAARSRRVVAHWFS